MQCFHRNTGLGGKAREHSEWPKPWSYVLGASELQSTAWQSAEDLRGGLCCKLPGKMMNLQQPTDTVSLLQRAKGVTVQLWVIPKVLNPCIGQSCMFLTDQSSPKSETEPPRMNNATQKKKKKKKFRVLIHATADMQIQIDMNYLFGLGLSVFGRNTVLWN